MTLYKHNENYVLLSTNTTICNVNIVDKINLILGNMEQKVQNMNN